MSRKGARMTHFELNHHFEWKMFLESNCFLRARLDLNGEKHFEPKNICWTRKCFFATPEEDFEWLKKPYFRTHCISLHIPPIHPLHSFVFPQYSLHINFLSITGIGLWNLNELNSLISDGPPGGGGDPLPRRPRAGIRIVIRKGFLKESPLWGDPIKGFHEELLW